MKTDAKKEQGKDLEVVCYALTLYTYDYYEFEETIAISFDKDKLKKEYENIEHIWSEAPLIRKKESEPFWLNEKPYWLIRPLKYLA